ncbi:hypothetical protein KXV22_004505 [Aspergillus fumigatus]|nr:hypothetical protein KXX14_006665 [Aspergillus fumigatus]KAH1450389.1 hypothetical protein KXX58_004960 [Aspergillus fumigatus]KAH1509526.1 hypothetical protein KXX29_005628 [Aspergillus fumigatus]KAH1511248.1 hypothetical protein KXX06_006204 [Aspergillus fumigatus]KAH1627210.1 hypothetical protein KXX39_005044 [Aspergillus fumigatus]
MRPRRPSTTQSLSEAELSVPVRLGRTRTLTITFPFTCLVLEFDLAIPVASSGSSHVVALVEYDPWADELLLCVGEASCSLPELNLEPLLTLALPSGILLDPEIVEATEERPLTFGGWGKAAMLIVLRSDFSGLAGLRPPDADLRLPWVEIELDNGDLLKFDLGLEGVRNLEVDCNGDDALLAAEYQPGDSRPVGTVLVWWT